MWCELHQISNIQPDEVSETMLFNFVLNDVHDSPKVFKADTQTFSVIEAAVLDQSSSASAAVLC